MNPSPEMMAIQFSVKLTIVLVAAWVAHTALSSRNPRWRVWLWRLTAVGISALLIAALLPPLYGIPLLGPAGARVVVPASVSIGSTQAANSADRQDNLSIRDEVPASAEFSDKQATVAPVEVPASVEPPMMVKGPTHSRIEGVAPVSDLQASSIGWSRCGWIVYALVLSCLLLRIAVSMLVVRREIRRTTAAPDWVQAIADLRTRDLDRREIPVRVTSRFASPLFVSVWRPMILLPEAMVQSESATQDVRGAIAHELAHAAGGDLFWDHAIAVITAFVWPHPLAWRARTAHRIACERVCDREAADLLGDLPAYQRLLARVALRVSGDSPSIGLAMARQAEIRRRLAAIANCPGVPKLGRRAATIAVGVTLALGLLGVGSIVTRSADAAAEAETPADQGGPGEQPDTAPKPVTRLRPEALRFAVVHSDGGQPVAEAKVTVRMYGEKPNINRELTTDTQGTATFEYPDGDQPVYLWATVHQPGLVPYYVNFGRNLIPAALPIEKTIRMDRGKRVGGRVVDPEGNAVAGAQLSITVPATDTPSEIHYHLLYETTGEDGAWLLDGAPLALAGLRVSIEHPRFIKSGQRVQDRIDGRYVLDPGFELSGHVTDREGNPIPNAHVTVGRDRWGRLDRPVPVAGDGRYVVYALSPQSTWVTVEAPGFAPRVKPVELGSETKPLNFELEPGQTTRFQVINDESEPVEGIRIVADTWNGFRSLWWQTTTNADGVATWNGAPPDAVEFHVLGSGYSALRDVVVAAQDEPHLIQIHRPLRIQGIVTDSRNKKIPEFRVVPGRKFPGRSEITWITHEGSTGRNGKFEFEYDEACDEIFLRIEAGGCRPWTSEAIPFTSSEHKVFVRLEDGSGPAGVVWSPDGRPVVGARITLLTESEGMQFTDGYRPSGGKQTVVSDQDGRFEFLPLGESALIVAVHDDGYAEMTATEIAESGGIQLQAWAKIEAIVRRGNEPLAGAKVSVTPQWQRDQIVRVFSYGISGTTDIAGRVTFDRVVPRNAIVSQTIEQPIGPGTTVYPERSAKLSLAPGETARVELGGSGVAITGQLVIHGEPPARHQWSLNDAIRISTAREEGDANATYYRCLIDKSGSFRANDIPPGRYDLRVDLTAAPDPNVCGHGETIGRIVKEIEVPGGGTTLDLGVIEGSWFERLGAGDQAPRFVAPGIGREDVRLRDLRGRLVLIDFWATWCQPCMAEMPALVELHKEFAANERFRMLGLSLDNSIEDAMTSVEKHGWPWEFAFAGPGTNATIPSRFEVQSIPEKFLIDVDGTILFRGRDLDAITKLVRERLAQLPAEVSSVASGAARAVPVTIDDNFPAGQPIALASAASTIDYRLASDRTGSASLTGPGLLLWSKDGTIIRKLEGVGTSAWLTGPQRLAIDPRRGRLYYCDTMHHRIVALNRFGRQLFATDVPDLHAVAVDEQTGDIWCLTLANLNSGELVVLDAEGREKDIRPLTAFGLAYSPAENAFWIVGKQIAKVNREGNIVCRHALPDGAYTLSDVAVDRERGGAWILEVDHPDIPSSQRRLWKALPDGTVMATHTFPEKTVPRALACVAGEPWLAVMKNYSRGNNSNRDWEVQQFSLDGVFVRGIDLPASDIAVGLQSGTIWLRAEDRFVQIDQEGNTLQVVPLTPEFKSVQISAF